MDNSVMLEALEALTPGDSGMVLILFEPHSEHFGGHGVYVRGKRVGEDGALLVDLEWPPEQELVPGDLPGHIAFRDVPNSGPPKTLTIGVHASDQITRIVAHDGKIFE